MSSGVGFFLQMSPKDMPNLQDDADACRNFCARVCRDIPTASIFGSSGNNIQSGGWCEQQVTEDVLPKGPPPFPGRQYMSCSGHVSLGMCELVFCRMWITRGVCKFSLCTQGSLYVRLECSTKYIPVNFLFDFASSLLPLYRVKRAARKSGSFGVGRGCPWDHRP